MLNIIKGLLDENLVDVLGVSLKGLNEEEALETSGIKNVHLCWNNVLETIKIASKCRNVRVIVTYVAYDDFDYDKLCEFANILEKINDNIYLKINNLCGDKHRNMSLKALEKDILPKMISNFLEQNPKWKDKVILINSSEGVTDYSKIIFS